MADKVISTEDGYRTEKVNIGKYRAKLAAVIHCLSWSTLPLNSRDEDIFIDLPSRHLGLDDRDDGIVRYDLEGKEIDTFQKECKTITNILSHRANYYIKKIRETEEKIPGEG